MRRWYLVHTKPSSEALAHANLSRQGYEVYLPRAVQAERRAGRWHERIVALFPRYLFLRQADDAQSLAPVRSSIGVSAIVQFGSGYAVVPDRIVGELRSRADPESGLHRVPPPAFTPGCPVKITSGVFEGLEAIFQRAVGSERIVVLLRILGQEAAVRVPAGFIIPGHSA